MTRRMAIIGVVAVAVVTTTATPARADGIRDSQWHLAYLDVAAAHRLAQGLGVTVAIVDSGVDADHPDLTDTVMPGLDVAGGSEASGRVDVDGRGTGLAGLVAGHGHGSRTTLVTAADGVLGVAPGVRILPIAITSRPGQFGDPDVLAEGIDAAVARGAKVICVGRGLPASPALERATAAAIRAGVIVVAPTGNRRGETFLPWPASYPGVVAVAPLDRAGGAALTTASPSPSPTAAAPRGPTPTVAAPGIDLVTTDTRSGYRIDAGSGAAALVAGIAALIVGLHPQLTAEQVVARLTATASDRGPAGVDGEYGHGVVNPVRSLTEVVPTQQPSPRSTATASPTSAATAAAPTPPPPAAAPGRPAFDSTDWRRWMVATPLVAFLTALVLYSTRGRRRTAR